MAADSTPDPKDRFSSRVKAYVAHRPRYPREVVNHLREVIGLTKHWTIADVGSGTGISAELFLQNGNPVYGVEPNAPMRSAAEASLGGFGSFHSIDGSAESTTLSDHSIDLYVAAQAFHWFDIPAARAEAMRILRPGGFALLMWNDRLLAGSAFLEAYEQLLLDFGTDYTSVRHDNVDDARLRAFFGPGGYVTATFPNAQHLDLAGLRGRVRSSSYVPAEGDPRYEPMLARIGEIFDRHHRDGAVTLEYQTRLFHGPLTYG